jgi:hypothetical protein
MIRGDLRKEELTPRATLQTKYSRFVRAGYNSTNIRWIVTSVKRVRFSTKKIERER